MVNQPAPERPKVTALTPGAGSNAQPKILVRGCESGLKGDVRIVGFFALSFLAACVPDLSTICPHHPITQGVFGGIVDANNTLEQNVKVDLYTMLNGVQSTMAAASAETTRGGYQLNVDPSTYILCAKTVCATVTVPTGLVELSAVDAASGLTWDAPVAVPPAQTVGPCTFGN
jgi:hypothetical protein